MKKYIPYMQLPKKKKKDEAVGLKSPNYTQKLQFLRMCEIWGNFVKIWYFVNNCFI